MMTVITDQTREAALEKFRDYQRYVSPDGALTLMSGWTGVDFSALPKHEPVRFQAANAMFSALESFTTADPDRTWTVEEIARHAGIGGRGPVIVGSYQDIADEFSDWMRETDVDGFNLAYAVTPETFVDIVDWWYRNCAAAACIRPSTQRVRCVRNCTAQDGRDCRKVIRQRGFE
jgi:alkanesulfonate monooxygenase SsuD/methylene tetrahydromethanopterin reductase-like flavin-dependent oxidoreductase (luciferase family)